MSKIKPTIKIMRNCQNGEHVFIPALTHQVNLGADEHDLFVTAFVCQHCLYYVSDDVWAAHLQNSYMCNEPEPANELDQIKPKIEEVKKDSIVGTGTGGGGSNFKSAIEPKKIESKLPYPGKKRGPKSKQMNIPGTSNS